MSHNESDARTGHTSRARGRTQMKVKNAAMAALRWSRHGLHAVRSLSPLAAFGLTAALVLGGAGIASAANGGNFLLGKFNAETSTAWLKNTKGPALKLIAPANAAPLQVSNHNLVSGLNAQYVNGMSPSQLATGGDGFTGPTTNTHISNAPAEVVSTGALAAGTYYVTATALLHVATGDTQGFCYITKGSSNGSSALDDGGATQVGYFQAAETVAASVNAGDTLQEWCVTGGNTGSVAYNAGITAIRVLSSSGTTPAVHGNSSAAAPGR
jgi:hypothetical protein